MRDEKIDFIHVDLSTWRNQIKKELKENHSRIVFNDEIEEILFDVTQTSSKSFITTPKDKNSFLNGYSCSVFNEKEANKTILKVLMQGADFIEFKLEKKTNIDWEILFNTIEFQYIFSHIAFQTPQQLASFLEFIDPKKLQFFFLKIDPLAINFSAFKEILESHSVKTPCFEINGFEIEQIGANCYQQIGIMLSTFHELLSTELEEGNSIYDFIHLIHFNVGIGQNYFIEIAKIKSLKWLIQQISYSYGIINFEPTITANIGWINKSLKDIDSNLLRQTSEAMAALNAGVNGIIVHPCDNFSNQKSSTLHQRMALNIPIILKEEANFNSVYEPLNGSHVIEGLSEEISEKSWFYFTELEKFNVLRSNEKINKISSDIYLKRSMRIEAVKTNQKEYIGINTLFSENLCSAEWTDTKEYIGIPYLILEQEFQKK
jgi:methylmalonyl-CoA mutase